MLEIMLVFAGLCALFALVVVGLCIYEAAEFERDDWYREAMQQWYYFEDHAVEPEPVMPPMDWRDIRDGARLWFRDVQTWGFRWPLALRTLFLPPTDTCWPPDDDDPIEVAPVDQCDFCHEEIPNADGLWVFVGGCYPVTGLACPACYLKYTGYFGASTEDDPTPTHSQQAYRAAYHRT